MKFFNILTVISLALLVLVISIYGAEPNSTINPSSTPGTRVVKNVYPNVEMGFLNYAVVSDLPDGVLLRADNVVIESKELNKTIADANEKVRPLLKKYASLVLEQVSIPKLFALEIKSEAAKTGREITEKDDTKILQNYFAALSKTVKVSDAEMLEFYNTNKDSLSGATLAQVKPQIQEYLVQEKMQALVNEKANTIGQRMKIEISAAWLKNQAALEKDNPVNKARDSGKPTMVDFSSKGCVPCDMLAPILKTLQGKYNGKANIVVVQTSEEPILASRYKVEVIPIQIFYDKTGKEVFRHVGFYAQTDIEQKLSEIGAK
jgi:thiol-disulfide isomerase/thioredoxin